MRRYLVALYADGEGIRAYELESDVGELVRGATVKISLAAALYEQALAFLREFFIDILARYRALGHFNDRARTDKRFERYFVYARAAVDEMQGCVGMSARVYAREERGQIAARIFSYPADELRMRQGISRIYFGFERVARNVDNVHVISPGS